MLRKYAGIAFIVLILGMILYLRQASDGFVDAGRCGIDLPSCKGSGVRCINGYCRSDQVAPWPPLPSIPSPDAQ